MKRILTKQNAVLALSAALIFAALIVAIVGFYHLNQGLELGFAGYFCTECRVEDGGYIIEEVPQRSPAHRAGVQVGDRLVQVDDIVAIQVPPSISSFVYLNNLLPGSSGEPNEVHRVTIESGHVRHTFNLILEQGWQNFEVATLMLIGLSYNTAAGTTRVLDILIMGFWFVLGIVLAATAIKNNRELNTTRYLPNIVMSALVVVGGSAFTLSVFYYLPRISVFGIYSGLMLTAFPVMFLFFPNGRSIISRRALIVATVPILTSIALYAFGERFLSVISATVLAAAVTFIWIGRARQLSILSAAQSANQDAGAKALTSQSWFTHNMPPGDESGKELQQIKWIVLALGPLAVMAAIYICLFVFAQRLFVNPVQEQTILALGFSVFRVLASILLGGSIAAASMRHRLWGDIDLLLPRTFLYSILTILFVAVLGSIFAILDKIVNSLFENEQSGFSAIAATILTTEIFPPIKKWLENIINRIFSVEPLDLTENFSEIDPSAWTFISLDDIYDKVCSHIESGLVAKWVAVYEVRQNQEIILRGARGEIPETARPKGSPYQNVLNVLRGKLDEDECALIGRLEIEEFSPDDVSVSVILHRPGVNGKKHTPEGMILIGERKDGREYSREDTAALENLGEKAGTAIYMVKLREEDSVKIEWQ